jgi:hypothetical protein
MRNAHIAGSSPRFLLAIFILFFAPAFLCGRALADTLPCDDSKNEHLQPGSATTDLQVTGPCEVKAGTYTYRNVNVYNLTNNPANGGSLNFDDALTDFFAESIVVEDQGSIIAGSAAAPIGTNGGLVTIHLWGAPSDPGVLCKTNAQCGVPNGSNNNIWGSNPAPPMMGPPTHPATCQQSVLPGGVKDCFYRYETFDMSDGNAKAYFGHKVLAVSYGGTLQLFGKDGATYSGREVANACLESTASCAGTSWARLTASLKPGDATLTINAAVDWQDSDHIVVTTTDFLPGHSEELIVSGAPVVSGNTTTINFTNADGVTTGVKWPHNGVQYTYGTTVPVRVGVPGATIENRASVALLSRSIRIFSAGNSPTDLFTATPGNYFGGHTLVRQGFLSVQIQGVQFHQLGQGGSIMHYPVHFHLARRTPQPAMPSDPAITFVKDCSIDDSMTRWITLHGSQGVLLARNVGYKSIGHGFYLEDGTETDNRLYSNIGIFARAAVDNAQNPRQVPGILTATTPQLPNGNPAASGYDNFPYYSDANHPADFWIMNGDNDFEYNMAAGAGTCGACYWFVPGGISGPSQNEKWFGYASEQTVGREGTTPLEKFIGNSCSSAMNAFTEVGDTSACNGVNNLNPPPLQNNIQTTLRMLPSDGAKPAYTVKGKNLVIDPYYWPIVSGGGRLATRCPAADKGNLNAECGGNQTVPICSDGQHGNCDVTVLDGFTTSFNWAQQNFAAIWMRPFWSLVINSAVTDVLNGGLNFVTSGDFSRSSVITGFWALARHNLFVGSTQWHNPQPANAALNDNPLTSNAGAFNPFVSKTLNGPGTSKLAGLVCAPDPVSGSYNSSYCLSADEGVAVQLNNFSTFQRFFSVYDGPTYQDSNAFLDIQPTYLTSDGNVPSANNTTLCSPNAQDGNPCVFKGFMNSGLPAILADNKNNACYFPNAAIGWKQPNGFYYAPAFHSANLFFNNVGIRHFVTEPLFVDGTFDTDVAATKDQYCYWGTNQAQPGLFTGFTDIDRETVLNDDDGTLTGLTSTVGAPVVPKTETISVNKENFFDAPIETPECASDLALNSNGDAKCPPNTAKTSPYEYVTAALYPECALTVPNSKVEVRECADGNWGSACTTSAPQSGGCIGVPIYRQYLTDNEMPGLAQQKRMMGQNTFQRSALTVNHGSYYIDTTISKATQINLKVQSVNVFTQQGKYDLFFVYAKKNTKQMYKIWVGPGRNPNLGKTNVKFGYVDIDTAKYKFQAQGTGALPAGWSSQYVDPYLVLNVDMNGIASDFDLTQPKGSPLGSKICQPSTMCSWSSTSNTCACNPSSPYFNQCTQTNPSGQNICSWSVKDLDCPAQGCPGLQITMPGGFAPDDAPDHHRPAPAAFSFDPNYNANWNVPFNLEDNSIAGQQCTYTQQPPLTCP